MVALCDGGGVYTWGGNSEGQLGHGDRRDRKLPELVRVLTLCQALNGTHVTRVSAGKCI